MLRKFGTILGICIAGFVVLFLSLPLLTGTVSEEKLLKTGVIEPESSFVNIDGSRIRYVAKGLGDDVIIFIHGFSSSLSTWRACLDTIGQQHRVYSLDLLGFGFSDKPSTGYTIDGYVDLIVKFMDATDIRSAVLCGNSMGGNIAWRVALKYPNRVDRLILVDASGYPSDHGGAPLIMKLGRIPGVGELFGMFTTRGQIRSSLESAYFENSKVTDQTVERYFLPLKTEGGMRAVLARLRGSDDDKKNWHEQIPLLKLPTLIVWGSKDTWVPVEDAHRFNKDIAGSELRIIPQCGHLPQEEMPAEFSQHVLDFLNEQALPESGQTPILEQFAFPEISLIV